MVAINLFSDPQNTGDPVNLELAIYEFASGGCLGNLSLINSSSTIPSFDESLNLFCLEKNKAYFLLVDGFGFNADLVRGVFSVEIIGVDAKEGNDRICDRSQLRAILEGDSAASTATLTGGDSCYLLVVDDGGCQEDTAFFVPYLTTIIPQLTVESVSCNGATGAIQEELTAGTYEITVVNSDNCTDIVTVTIEQPEEQLQVNIMALSGVSCHGKSDGRLLATTNSPDPQLRFSWNNGRRVPEIGGLAAGSYIVGVKVV